MDATILVQDFLLEDVTKTDIQNYERITATTKWTVTESEAEFLTRSEQGKPGFEAGGLFFIGA